MPKKNHDFCVLVEGDGQRRYITRLFDAETGPPTVYVWGGDKDKKGLMITCHKGANGKRSITVERQTDGSSDVLLVEELD